MTEDVQKACTALYHPARIGPSEVSLCSETAPGPCSHTVQQSVNYKLSKLYIMNMTNLEGCS